MRESTRGILLYFLSSFYVFNHSSRKLINIKAKIKTSTITYGFVNTFINATTNRYSRTVSRDKHGRRKDYSGVNV